MTTIGPDQSPVPVIRLSDDDPAEPKVMSLWLKESGPYLEVGGLVFIGLVMWKREEVAQFFATAAALIDAPAALKALEDAGVTP